jgi:hypothetical protein
MLFYFDNCTLLLKSVVAFCSCFSLLLQGVGIPLRLVFTTGFKGHTPPIRQKVLSEAKMPQSTSRALSSHAQSSHPTFEQREIIFKTEFDINGDFKNFEATQWAIQEIKCRGSKKLCKPITSTAYTGLVVQL